VRHGRTARAEAIVRSAEDSPRVLTGGAVLVRIVGLNGRMALLLPLALAQPSDKQEHPCECVRLGEGLPLTVLGGVPVECLGGGPEGS
jgi:hypothetical protein